MADYISRQAAINIVCHDDCEDCPDFGCVVYRRLKRLPSADVVEVVRCKDCKEFQTNHRWCGFLKTDIDPDEFCSYGERRDGQCQ